MNDDTYQVNGLTIKIEFDEYAESPREWDNAGTMVCWHNRYNLGDKHDYSEPDDFLADVSLSADDPNCVFMLPLYLYDHSGITMYTDGDGGYRQHEAWDSGQVGWIYISVEQARKEWPAIKDWKKLKAQAYKQLRAEIKDYDSYLTGQVFCYTVTNPKDGEIVDSCCGFFDEDQCRAEAESVAKSFIKPPDAAYAKTAKELHR